MQELLDSVKSLSTKERKALAALLKRQGVNLYGVTPIYRREPAHGSALSYAQQRQWFLWQLDPDSAAYTIPAALRLTGRLDVAALQRSFEQLVARHETLRTTFTQQGDEALQIVHPSLPATVEVEPVQIADPLEREAAIKARVEAHLQQPFDLEHGPLLRVRLLALGAEEHVLVLGMHHIVSDGWSMPILVDELIRLYQAECQGVAAALEPLPIQYADYALWQRDWMQAGEQERQLGYWRERLAGEQPVLELPTDHPRPQVQSFKGARLPITLDSALAQDLKALARQQGVTLFMLLLAAFQTVLHRYSGQAEIRVGVPVANRSRAETQGLIGFFVNTQVLDARFAPTLAFTDLLQQVRQTALQAQAHQDLPFEQLVEALQPERSLSHNPLFQVMFNHQTAQRGELRELPGLSVQGLDWDSHNAQLDLSLDTVESPEGLSAALTYACDLFERSSVERLGRYWLAVLREIVRDPRQLIGELTLMDPVQVRRVKEQGAHLADFSDARCVHQLIAERAALSPDAVALICEGERLSYQALNRRANRIAHRLRALGVGPDVAVGIAIERSLDMVVSVLAVLKAGGAYVPLDPEYPAERLVYMMQDSGLRLLLTQTPMLERLSVPAEVHSLCLDQGDDWLQGCPEDDPHNLTAPANLAYIMYTSGSTGRPKGVGISAAALTEHALGFAAFCSLSDQDRVLQFSTFNFDAFVEQLYPSLIVGARILLRGPALWDSETWYHQVIEHGITFSDLPTAYWYMLAKDFAAKGPRDYGMLRRVHMGGEAMAADGVPAWRAAGLSHVELINTYGPTEATVTITSQDCTAYVTGEVPLPSQIPIGKALAGRSIYLVDGAGNLALPGAIGELLVGGELLARGYHQRPGLSAERFIPDPFGEQPGGRLYRTGDLARYRADGVIEFAGRVDHQVKIRGFRIELGEIDAKLREHPGIREVLVVDVDGPSGKQLAAYLVASATVSSDLRSDLLRHLKAGLPDYMVPAHLIFLDALPQTPNGKLDRKALPKPDSSQSQADYQAPRSELEQQVAAIWAEVLKVERVGLGDNFFELGGHSLLATQVTSRLRQRLNLEVSLRSLFEAADLQSFSEIAAQGAANQAPVFTRVDRQQPLVLSYAQQRQWFLWQLQPQSAAYNIPSALRLTGELDVLALQRSFEALIARHETLRTTFFEHADQAWQRIHAPQPFTLPVEAVHDDSLLARIAEQTRQPFDLVHGPLLRACLLRLGEHQHVLVLTLHHSVADGWSMPIMVDEVMRLYAGFCQGQPTELPPLAFQYADYAAWQRRWMEAGEQARQLAYWRQQLGDEQPVLELPLDRPRGQVQDTAGDRLDIVLPAALTQTLKATARQHGVTVFVLLLAAFQALLHRLSGQSDIRVGVPIANRTRAETERLIGFFVNTQVLKAEFAPQTTVGELLQQVKRAAMQAQVHQDLPFEQLVEALQPERSLSHNPLFQVMFNHQVHTPAHARQLPGLTIEGVEWATQASQFDLTLDTLEHEDGMSAALTYATALFDRQTVERMAQAWRQVLQGLCEDSAQRVASLPLFDEIERGRIVQEGTASAQYTSEQCLHALIEAQAARAPQAIAVSFAGESLSYGDLNRRANRLAHKLREQGVGPDVLVGLAVERSFGMIVGLLAILKAGGAYVPLDPEYPQDRLSYMIEDSGIALLVTQERLLGDLSVPSSVRSVLLDDALEGYSDENPEHFTQPANLAYVIYTSGSTGKPKGTLLPHHNVLRLFKATEAWFSFGESDVWTLFHSYAFDFSVWEIFGTLLHGGRLVIVPRDVTRSPEDFHQLLVEQGVTVLNQTPSAFKPLMRIACNSDADLALRQVIFGGEALDVAALQPWFERFGQECDTLTNMYGITETTVHVTYRPIRYADTLQSGSPIGAAIPDLSMYVLDADFNPVAPGCNGELHVGRAGLARGYHNRPSLTAERFVPDPFSAEGGRLYRTGDLARYRSQDVIEYVGRIDHQVKIRGFRIELGEIEARLQANAGVREVLVLDIDGAGGKQLVAYLIPQEAEANHVELRDILKQHLKSQLPDYMVPTHFVLLDHWPLTANGKLDRKALPKPDASQLQQGYVAPRTPLEQQLAAIWSEVLDVEQVGLHDNFFELGGHSLLATQVTSRIRQRLNLEVPLRALFEASNLDTFAQAVANTTASEAPPLVATDRSQPLALSYAQQRQWFLWQLEPDSTAYHIPAALRLQGRLNPERLRLAFEALIARHETLRTTFHQDGEQTVQRVHPPATFTLVMETLYDSTLDAVREQVAREVRRPFDLGQGPLLRVRLLRVGEDEHVLVLTLHHIVADGWSMPILVDEVVGHYLALEQGAAAEPTALPVQYADYAAWQRQWMQAGEQARQLQYWLEHLGQEHYVLQLPTDHPRPTVQSHAGRSLQVSVPTALAEALKARAREQGVTLFMLLLASFQSLLHRLSGQEDIRVGVPVANRTRSETEGLIGFFVNTQVLKARFAPHTTFSALLEQVRDTAVQAQAHQDLPFEHLVEALQPERSLSHNPLFQVIYNHQTYAAETVRQLPELTLETLDWDEVTAHVDLSLDTFESASGLGATLTYASDLFEAATVERLGGYWLNLLQAVCEQPGQRILDLPLLDGAQRKRLLTDWSRHDLHGADARPVQQLIEAQAQRTPEAIALVCEGQQLSYQALDARANQLAHRLRALGVGPEVRVGIALPRSLDMVVGLLAVLKAGGAYVPLDPDYPQARLQHMIQDSGLVLLLCHADSLDVQGLPAEVRSLCLDNEPLEHLPSVPVDTRGDADNLAYVMYTSGSTGRPKGVAISAAALSRHAQVARGFCDLNADDCVLQFSTFNFDAFVEQLYPALICGARVVLRGPELWDSETFYRQVLAEGITFADLPTAYWYLLAKDFAARGVRDYGALRRIHMGGEAMAADGVLAWQQAGLGHVRLLNTYGPTEATVSVMSHDCSAYVSGEQPLPTQIPIGKPLAGRSIHLVDAGLDLALPDALGELLVGGDLLARGYHGRPGQTAERFIPDPFSATPGARLYRTGDLGRYRGEAGVVEYAGRIDHQVKIRGFRIELGEIEARLREHPAVREVLVVDIASPTGRQLAAYVVASDPAASDETLRSELRHHLAASLPDYMVPQYLVALPRMPQLPNGKLDRQALPLPDTEQGQAAYVAPVSELEQQLAALWAEVLKVERVGLNHDFFALGGHSLLAAQLISKINTGLGIDIPLRLLFEKPHLNEFAAACAATGLSLSEDGLSDIERMMNEMAGV
ncbi:amino acid adenylation domain-containing protein [Pseudomonas sp. S75]|uniref:non-ribosomal peptide synthetase n=1 Tax=Pseudomonas sp. S75 TaxID=2767446 RepID=UPI001908B17F|nr:MULTISPECIES: non-ribosomal peptide synthetase [unclassified Pseudomonas]MBJ9978441.1 amino acid adenylation domain-containing protein [Pseudomonas sp. S30]MBK0152261.1 amino acid adenylation domain-containing protein [Pseudomonas sp. S75]